MKSKITKIQKILIKGMLLILMLAILLPSSIYAVEGLTLQESTTLEKLMYGEIGSVVKKIEEHFKSNTTLYIVNETQLRALAEYVNSGNSCQGKKIELLNDIKLNKDIDWMPIGNSYSEFSGTFYGNGYTISNLTYMNRENYETEGGYSNVGLFGVISKNGKVEKVNVNDSNITSNGLNSANINHVGNIAGTSYGIIKDCSANKMPLNKAQVNEGTSDNNYIGLLVGEKKAGTITTTTNQQPEVNFTVNGDTIKGDFKFYQKQGENFVEITDFVNTTYLKVNDTIRFEFTLDKYLYTGLEDGRTIKLANTVDDEGNVTEEIPKENYPMVSFAGVKATPIEVIQKEITLEDNTKKPQTKLVYEYTAIGEEEKESSSSNITVNFTKNKDNENLYVYYSDDKVNFNTGDKIAQNVYISGVSIKLDSKVPSIKTEAYVEDALENNRYAEGKEIIIKVTSSEQIQATKAPELKVSFSESGLGKYNYQTDNNKGNAVHVDAILDGEGKTTWIYSYIIQPGDEGNLNVQYISGTIKDLCENETDITTLEVYTSDIYADTTAPTVEIIADKENPTNADEILYTFEFSEMVEGLAIEDITVNNGKIVSDLVRKGSIYEKIIQNGDYNQDGKIDSKDATDLLMSTFFNEENLKYDFNGDGVVTDSDAIILNQYAINGSVTGEKLTYELRISTDIENGNVGNLQVIIEKDACQDLVGHGNIRAESTITVDKKAPILLSLEAYAASYIALNKDIDIVKENYKIGEDITIVATFDENIVSLEENVTGLPELALQFSKSGNAKGTVSGRLEGNKIIYTYKIVSGDEGTLSVKGFTGIVIDAAGNETRVTKRVLDGDTIIADTKAPTINELKVITEKGTYNAGKTVTIEAIYTEDVYALENNEIKNIVSTIAPTLKFKFGNGEEREAVAVGYGTKEDGTKDKSKVIYTCTVVDGDNGSLTITSYANKENVKVCDIAGNEAVLVKNQTGNEVIADTIRPQVTNITASVENPSITNTGIYHKEGNTVKITLTFDEKVSGAVLCPTIQVGFSEIEGQEPDTYNDYAYESDWNVNSQTIEYSYTIKAGDNGYLWIKVPEGQFKDAAWNTNVAEEATRLSNVFADTTVPTITLLKDTSVDQANQTITVKATFSEDVYDLNNNSRENLTTTNTPKLIYSFGTGTTNKEVGGSASGAVITYVITKNPVNDNGTLHYELAKGNLCDRAGNEYYQETTDTTAPILKEVEISSNAATYNHYCKAGTEIYVTATFDEAIAGKNIKLKATIGDVEIPELNGESVAENSKQIRFTYTVKAGDNGEFKIKDICGEVDSSITEENADNTYGWVRDEKGNQNNIYSLADEGITHTGKAEADTKAPYITSIKAKVNDKEIATYTKEEGKDAVITVGRTNANIIEYIVTYNEKIPYNHFDRIAITNGIIKDVQYTNYNLNEYKITVQTTVEGVQSLIIPEGTAEDKAGNTDEFVRLDAVTVDFTKPTIRFISEYNGGVYVLPTSVGKIEIRPNVEINEDISKIEYKWNNDEYAVIDKYSSTSDIVVPTKEFTEAGEYTLSIRVTDIAGNTTVASKEYSVKDSEINITSSNEEPTNQDVMITVEFEEGLTDNRKVAFKPEGSNEYKGINPEENGYRITENGTVYAEATDKVGNKVFIEKVVNNIDKVAPEVELSINGGNLVIGTGKDRATVKTTVKTNEPTIIEYEWFGIRNDSTSWSNEWKNTGEFTNELDLSTTIDLGTCYLNLKVHDAAGNKTEFQSLVFNVKDSNSRVSPDGSSATLVEAENTIQFERHGQYVDAIFGNNLSENRNIELTKEEDGYVYDNYVEVLKPTTVTATASDVCGNTVIATYVVESVEGPEFEVIGNPKDWTNQDVKLEVSTYDALKALTVNGEDILSKEENIRSNIVVSENGDYEFIATDTYGNISKKTVKVEKIDKGLPVISKVENEGKDITITATDELSGVAEYAITSTTETPVEWSKSNVIKTTKDGIFYVWAKDNAGNVTMKAEAIIVDTTAPTIAFNYSLSTVIVETPIETTITTNEDAKISYSWDNETWVDSEEFITSLKVSKETRTTGSYTLYAKAADKSGNISKVQTIKFTVIENPDNIKVPEIIFEDLPTIQVNGVKYVKISAEMTSENVTNKMDKNALCEATPKYTKLTSDNKLKTGSEITINDETKYVIVVNGDTNCDGKVSPIDVTTANSIRLNKVKANIIQQLAADFDLDGVIKPIDITMINSYRLGKIKGI